MCFGFALNSKMVVSTRLSFQLVMSKIEIKKKLNRKIHEAQHVSIKGVDLD